MVAVPDTPQTEALHLLAAGVDALAEVGVEPADEAEARALITGLEVLSRRFQGAQVDLLAQIDRKSLHRIDGHPSAKVMVRHHAKLSNPEAARRARAARALRDLPAVAAAFRSGRIGPAQVDRGR